MRGALGAAVVVCESKEASIDVYTMLLASFSKLKCTFSCCLFPANIANKLGNNLSGFAERDRTTAKMHFTPTKITKLV